MPRCIFACGLCISKPNVASQKLPSLIVVMARRLFVATPSKCLNQWWFMVNLTAKNKLLLNFNQNIKLFGQSYDHIDWLIEKEVTPLLTHWSYVFLALTHWYIVGKISAIWSTPKCVKVSIHVLIIAKNCVSLKARKLWCQHKCVIRW